VPTLHNDDSGMVKGMEHLVEGPLVVARDLVVTLKLLLWPGDVDLAQVWLLSKCENTMVFKRHKFK